MRLRRKPLPSAASHQRGAVGGIEMLPFGLLIFFAGTMLIANTWVVIDAKMATSSAARESVRFLVESDGDINGALAHGESAFDAQVKSGGALGSFEVESGGVIDSSFVRCARVTATYEYTTPVISVPFIGSWGNGIHVQSSHSEIVDPYRAGLGTASLC